MSLASLHPLAAARLKDTDIDSDQIHSIYSIEQWSSLLRSRRSSIWNSTMMSIQLFREFFNCLSKFINSFLVCLLLATKCQNLRIFFFPKSNANSISDAVLIAFARSGGLPFRRICFVITGDSPDKNRCKRTVELLSSDGYASPNSLLNSDA